MDPVEFRIVNDTQVDPGKAGAPLLAAPAGAECLKIGAERFGWSARNPARRSVRDGRWLVGLGMAVGFRNNLLMKSAARVRLGSRRLTVTVETDMTDIGTGSYTIIAQTAAEMMGVPLEQVEVRLGDSRLPGVRGSGGQWGANNSTSGVYAACVKLREAGGPEARLQLRRPRSSWTGRVRSGNRDRGRWAMRRAGRARRRGPHRIRRPRQEVPAVHLRRALRGGGGGRRSRARSACAGCSRCARPGASSTRKSARSQVIGAMTMGVGAALMEELAVDKQRLLRQPRPGRLRGAGARRHPAPGGRSSWTSRTRSPRP